MKLYEELHILANQVAARIISHKTLFEKIERLKVTDSEEVITAVSYRGGWFPFRQAELESRKRVARDAALYDYGFSADIIQRVFDSNFAKARAKYTAELKRIDEMA